MGPLLFIIFINDIDGGITSRILKFADDMKIIGRAGDDKETEMRRKDLEILHNWSEDWQMKFNVEKCKVMHIGASNKKATYEVDGKPLEIVTEEKDLGVIISNDLKVSKQCCRTKQEGRIYMPHRTEIIDFEDFCSISQQSLHLTSNGFLYLRIIENH